MFPPPAHVVYSVTRKLYLATLFALTIFIGTACSSTMPDVASPSQQLTNSLASPDASLRAVTRLAQLDDKKMRVRAYTKRNGPRQLVSSQALKFERVGATLNLVTRRESLVYMDIGRGVELVGSRGYAQALPPCNENYALEDWGVTCALPFCEEVNNVEPCEPTEPWDPYPNDPVQHFYDSLAVDPALLEGVAEVFTEAVSFTPVPQDSIASDSVGVFLGDTLGTMTSIVVDSDGLPIAAAWDDGENILSVDYEWSYDELTSVTIGLITAGGDSLLVEYIPELDDPAIRRDLSEISQARMTSWFANASNCGPEIATAIGTTFLGGAAIARATINIVTAISPATKGVRALKSGLNVYEGLFKGAVVAEEIRTASNIATIVKKELWTLSGVGTIATSLASIVGSGATIVGAVWSLGNCMGWFN